MYINVYIYKTGDEVLCFFLSFHMCEKTWNERSESYRISSNNVSSCLTRRNTEKCRRM